MDEINILQSQTSQTTNTEVTTKCLNCGTVFHGKFCPECGQRADTQRFTIKSIFQNFILGILSNDGGVWITLKSLFTKPGQMMVDFINGKRKSFFSPFPMLFLTLSFYIVIFTFTGSKKNDYDKMFSDENQTEIPADLPIDTVSNHDNIMHVDDENDEITEDVKSIVLRYKRFYDKNYTTVFILTIPFYILSARVCFGRKNRKKYNSGEYCIPMVYSLIIIVLYRCLTSLVFYFSEPLFDKMEDLNPLVTIIAFTACFKKMMDFSTKKMIWRSFLTHIFYYIVVAGIFGIVLIVYVAARYGV